MSANPVGPQVRIRDLRIARDLTVKQLVERMASAGLEGVHEDTIRNVELGHKPASSRLMSAWARALGLNPLDVWQPSREPKTERVVLDHSEMEDYARSRRGGAE